MLFQTRCFALSIALGFQISSGFAQEIPLNLPPAAQERAAQTLGGLSPQDRAAAEKALGQLSPEQQAAARRAWDRLSPEEKAAAAKAHSSLSAQERDDLIRRAETELKSRKGPTTYHVVEGPGLPPSSVVESPDLMGSSANPPHFTGNVQKLFEAAKRINPNNVSFRRKKVDQFSDRGFGTGVLVSRTLVLTARHVAEQVAAKPEDFLLFQIGRPTKKFLVPLRFVEMIEVGTDRTGDPDLALVRVLDGDISAPLNLRETPLNVRDDVASLGCSEMEILPSMSAGIITTAFRPRDLGSELTLKRTVFGSSVRSFPGLSGSPVFDPRGNIIAVVLGGVKNYAGTGETVTHIGKDESWETFSKWTWATPTKLSLQLIINETKKDR